MAETDGLSEMLSVMTLSACPRIDVDQMEWNRKVVLDDSCPQSKPGNQQHIPDDESRDIVDILLTTNEMSKIIIDERY
jgi:hypothetical protein